MQKGQPSRTAFGVAKRRAVHQLWDSPRVLDDPVAVKIIGHDAAAEISGARPSESAFSVFLRAFVVARSRYAEDQLAQAVAHSVRQYVVLGAGLDTFAYRNPHRDLKVFEVDHPATQAWKQRGLRQAGIEIPPNLVFVPFDFESESLAEALNQGGFQPEQPAFFSWLGVTQYLERKTTLETLRWSITSCARNGVVFDYGIPRESLSPGSQLAFDALAARVADAGEPFVNFFDPADLARELRAMGYTQLEDLGADEINSRYFDARIDGLRTGGAGRLMCAQGDWVKA